MSSIEIVPTTWTASDEEFFRIVAHVFPPAFTFGASVLLAGNDVDCEVDFVTPAVVGRDLVPVPAVARR
jgi:hypothetical protein